MMGRLGIGLARVALEDAFTILQDQHRSAAVGLRVGRGTGCPCGERGGRWESSTTGLLRLVRPLTLARLDAIDQLPEGDEAIFVTVGGSEERKIPGFGLGKLAIAIGVQFAKAFVEAILLGRRRRGHEEQNTT